MSDNQILIIGYGNPGRQDDALGPALAERAGALGMPNVRIDADYQLNIEDAAELAKHDIVLFADASKVAGEPFAFDRVMPSSEIAFTSHSLSPESVLALTEDCFGARPEAWLLGVRGYGFDLAEGLTLQPERNLHEAVSFVQEWVGGRSN